jgi:hypothetical protein
VIPESFGINRFQGIRAHHLTGKAAAWTVAAAWHKDDPNPLIFWSIKSGGGPRNSESFPAWTADILVSSFKVSIVVV